MLPKLLGHITSYSAINYGHISPLLIWWSASRLEQALPWTVLVCHTPTPLTPALLVHYDKSMRHVAATLTPGPVPLAGDRFKRRPGRDNGCLGVDPIFTHFAICLEVELPDTY